MDKKAVLMKKLLEANTDFEERLRNSDIRVGYESEHDMLFITIGRPQPAITEEVSRRLHFRFDPDSDKIVGITITAFKKGFLREHQDFKRHFETVFERRRTIKAWEFVPQTEASEEATGALRGLVPA
ncbi:MAG: DUF2283 domain-containing protein [Anaerolineae bacterium]